ncbi:MAG: GNAT family N-acetyltransferase [Saprospiraceae bacterium]
MTYNHQYNNVEVRHLKDVSEFEKLDAIYQKCFGEHSVPSQRQKEWWLSASNNILGLFVNDYLVGGASFWHINSSIFEKLKTGKLRERDLTVHDFDFTCKNLYYFSDLAIEEEHRKKQYSNLLLSKMFDQILMSAINGKEIQILAFAFSESGSKILNRMDFVKILNAAETLDEQDLYLLQIRDRNKN